jgi:hypothetical protein
MKTITILSRKHLRKPAAAAAVAGLILLSLAGCKDFSFFNELGVKGGLTISPVSALLSTGGTMSFTASGGNGDYTFSVITSCGGTIDPVSGVYTAPGSECNDIIMVTDSTDLSATASVSVVSTLDELEINPKVATLSPGASITFVATGGVPPYEFSFSANNSQGTLSLDGDYTAGLTSGVIDQIIVTDADSTVCAIKANVSVVAATTYVDYELTAAGCSFPSSAYTGESISGTFTVTNVGDADGGKPVSWWLFLSEDGAFGGDPEILIASNITSELDAHATSSPPVTPSGTWPAEDGTFHILIMISAEDDMNHTNNKIDAGSISLGRPKVDYEVVDVLYTGGSAKIPGESLTGEFTYANNGPEDGILDLSWEVYASLNAAKSIDPADIKIASGTGLAKLSAGPPVSAPKSFSGSWPLEGGDYYLKVMITSPDDDQNTSNNIQASAVTRIGIFMETEPNDEWLELPGSGGFNVLEGASPPNPIVLKPGMSIRIEGADISKDNRDDVFRFNTGTADVITFTVTWASGSDDIDIYVWREPGGNYVAGEVVEVLGYRPDYLAAAITRGGGYGQFATEDLWLDIYCHIATGSPTPVPYTVVITAE